MILRRLSNDTRNEVLSKAKFCQLPAGAQVYGADTSSPHVYFLTDGVASLVARSPEGDAAEVGILGQASAPGAISMLGDGPIGSSCDMLTPATAYRLPIRDASRIFESRPDFRAQILDYIQDQSRLQQQLILCASHHQGEGRIARWLLAFSALAHSDKVTLTQEHLAQLLSAQRSTVSSIISSLQRDGLLEQRRGSILLRKKDVLETRACSCYGVWREIFQRRRREVADDISPSRFAEASDTEASSAGYAATTANHADTDPN